MANEFAAEASSPTTPDTSPIEPGATTTTTPSPDLENIESPSKKARVNQDEGSKKEVQDLSVAEENNEVDDDKEKGDEKETEQHHDDDEKGDEGDVEEEEESEDDDEEEEGDEEEDSQGGVHDGEDSGGNNSDSDDECSMEDEELSKLLWPTRDGVQHADPQQQMQNLMQDMLAMRRENAQLLERCAKRKASEL